MEKDLLAEDPSEYPTYFERAGFAVIYQFSDNMVDMHVYRFAGCCLPSPGLDNIEFESLHKLIHIKIRNQVHSFYSLVEEDRYGTMLTYYLDAVIELLLQLLDSSGVEGVDAEEMIEQLCCNNFRYMCSLN
ncbi:hypothetical protein H0W80_03820 [Candidatus Saccharibacteria bacterium]|nr:hypothetical protein [Candidatus Saccharibacteria bacterium]